MSDIQVEMSSSSVVQEEEKSRIRKKGVCMWFDTKKGFGFISPDDEGENVFAHHTEIHARGFRCLLTGEHVEYEIVYDEKGRVKAGNITGPGGSFVQGPPSPSTNNTGTKFQSQFPNQLPFVPTNAYDYPNIRELESRSNHSSPVLPVHPHFSSYGQYQMSPTTPYIDSPPLIYYQQQQPNHFSPVLSSHFSPVRYEYPSPQSSRSFGSPGSYYSPKVTNGIPISPYLYQTSQIPFATAMNIRYTSPVIALSSQQTQQQQQQTQQQQQQLTQQQQQQTQQQQQYQTQQQQHHQHQQHFPSPLSQEQNQIYQEDQQDSNEIVTNHNNNNNSNNNNINNYNKNLTQIHYQRTSSLLFPELNEKLNFYILGFLLPHLEKVDSCSFEFSSIVDNMSKSQSIGRVLSLVCKSWSLFVNQHSPLFFSHITLRKKEIPVNNFQYRSFSRYGINVLSLDLGSCSNLSESTLLSIPTLFPRLNYISLEDTSTISPHILYSLTTKCSFISSISLSKCPSITDSSIESLKELKLYSLNLDDCSNITNIGAGYISNYFHDLISLSLSGTRVTDKGLVQIVDSCTSLENIFLARCKTITRISTTALSEKCPNLKQLDFSSCDNITDSAIDAFKNGESVLKISHLNISKCPLITEKVILTLIDELPALSFLCVSDSMKLSSIPKSKIHLIHTPTSMSGIEITDECEK